MNIFNMIRSGIFLIAGLLTLIFADKILNTKLNKKFIKLHLKLTKETHFNYEKNKRTLRIFGVLFIIISVVLFIVSISQ